MDNKRTIICRVRLNKEEQLLFKEKSAGYQTVSAMIRDAVRQFNDLGTKRKLDALNEMTMLYRKYQQDLSWLGSNFNQAMKHANQLAIGGQLESSYFHHTLEPMIQKIMAMLHNIKTEEHDIVRKLVK